MVAAMAASARSTLSQVVNPSLPHDSYGPQVNACTWALTAMAAARLTLRIYCKFLRQRRLWWDDYILIAAWVMLLGGNICLTVAISFGFGKHSYDIDLKNYPSMLFVDAFAGTFMIIGAAWSKTAFAVTLLRISSGWHRSFIWFIIVSVNVIFCAAGIITWVRCMPIEKNWIMTLKGHCWSYSINVRYNVFTAGYSGLMDITLALLPWHMLWGLSINKKEKLSALAAMSMGIFAGITSFVKIYAIQDSGHSDIVDTVQLVVLATAEIAVTIIAASVPILRALARDKYPRAGPFLALDETEHWTRQRIADIDDTDVNPPPPVPPLPDLESIELQPAAKKRWDQEKLRVQHLSQIQEFDEATTVGRSPRGNAWTPI